MNDITLDRLPTVMTVPEVAYYLRLSRNGVRDLLKNGAIPGFKPGNGKLWRVYKRELELFLRRRGGTARGSAGCRSSCSSGARGAMR